MVRACVNPTCSTPFRYLRDGVVFRLDNSPLPSASAAPTNGESATKYYWLCNRCYHLVRLHIDAEGRVSTVPVRATERNQGASSRHGHWILSELDFAWLKAG